MSTERFTDADVELVSDATERHHITDRTDAMGHNACACDNWWDSADMEGWDEHMAAATLRALADAGRLLPPGGETREGLRPWEDLRSSGLLWLINRVVFHPRGWALAICYDAGVPVGWKLIGDGREPWRFEGDVEDALFDAAQATLTPLTPPGGPLHE